MSITEKRRRFLQQIDDIGIEDDDDLNHFILTLIFLCKQDYSDQVDISRQEAFDCLTEWVDQEMWTVIASWIEENGGTPLSSRTLQGQLLLEYGRFFEEGLTGAEGTFLERDYEQAAVFYERAIALGSTQAACQLGDLSRAGRLPQAGPEKDLLCYSLAAALGDPTGLYKMGDLYEEGAGTLEKSKSIAFNLYMEALTCCKEADPTPRIYMARAEILYRLGCFFADGEGVTADLIEATRHFNEAEVLSLILVTDHYPNADLLLQQIRLRQADLRQPEKLLSSRWNGGPDLRLL